MAEVILINCFEVPIGREDEFFSAFKHVNDYMRRKPGYVSHKLHRSIAPNAVFRFVNVVRWQSAEHCQSAHDDGFRKLVGRPEWSQFKSTPAIYEVVHQASAEK